VLFPTLAGSIPFLVYARDVHQEFVGSFIGFEFHLCGKPLFLILLSSKRVQVLSLVQPFSLEIVCAEGLSLWNQLRHYDPFS
jgi:hypothetical protein